MKRGLRRSSSRPARRFAWLLVAAVASAACGAASAPPQSPENVPPPGTSGLDGGAAPVVADGAPSASVAAPTSSSSSPVTVPPPGAGTEARVEMIGPSMTAFGPELQALGLDPKNLPAIDKLDPKALRGAMKLFAKSLGVKCVDCHEEGNFGAPTRRKRIATRMWNEFVVKLAMADGSPLFCDSCHRGRVVQLDRRDKKALAAWMDTSFVAPLTRKDGAPHDCETCHVDMNMTFLASWGSGRR